MARRGATGSLVCSWLAACSPGGAAHPSPSQGDAAAASPFSVIRDRRWEHRQRLVPRPIPGVEGGTSIIQFTSFRLFTM